MESSIKDNY
jgi:hypothetical protein